MPLFDLTCRFTAALPADLYPDLIAETLARVDAEPGGLVVPTGRSAAGVMTFIEDAEG